MSGQRRTIKVDMPAHWASYLINGDASGLVDYHGESLVDVHERLAAEGVENAHCVDVGEPFTARDTWTRLLTEMATYTFLKEPTK